MLGAYPNIVNRTCAVANTEYIFPYATSLVFMKVKARGGAIKFRFDTPAGDFITIADGTSEDFHNLGMVEEYSIESPTAGAVAEILHAPLIP